MHDSRNSEPAQLAVSVADNRKENMNDSLFEFVKSRRKTKFVAEVGVKLASRIYAKPSSTDLERYDIMLQMSRWVLHPQTNLYTRREPKDSRYMSVGHLTSEGLTLYGTHGSSLTAKYYGVRVRTHRSATKRGYAIVDGDDEVTGVGNYPMIFHMGRDNRVTVKVTRATERKIAGDKKSAFLAKVREVRRTLRIREKLGALTLSPSLRRYEWISPDDKARRLYTGIMAISETDISSFEGLTELLWNICTNGADYSKAFEDALAANRARIYEYIGAYTFE